MRELENAIERAVALARSPILDEHTLPPSLSSSLRPMISGTLREMEESMIRETLENSNWNKHEAARQLGVKLSTLYSKMKRYRILKPEF